jgi:plasmid stability protein
MEEEARHILKAGLTEESTRRPNLAESIRRRMAPIGGIELALPLRELVRQPPKLAK